MHFSGMGHWASEKQGFFIIDIRSTTAELSLDERDSVFYVQIRKIFHKDGKYLSAIQRVEGEK